MPVLRPLSGRELLAVRESTHFVFETLYLEVAEYQGMRPRFAVERETELLADDTLRCTYYCYVSASKGVSSPLAPSAPINQRHRIV